MPGNVRKRRPFLVVSRDAFNRDERYSKVLVVHLTSALRPRGPFDWEVEVARATAGLPRSSVAKCNEIYTIFKADLDRLIGTLPVDVMARIDRALELVLDLRVHRAAND